MAAEVARALGAPLDVIVVRKLGVPFQPELAMGALGEDGVRITNDAVLWAAGIGPCELTAVEHHERAELDRRVQRFRGDRPRIPLAGRIAVIVDDGMATGATAVTACRVARAHGARSVIQDPLSRRSQTVDIDVSRRFTPSSRARWMVAIDSLSSASPYNSLIPMQPRPWSLT